MTNSPVDYALALLNPAPPVEGDGLLVRVRFLAKAEGQTTISIADGLYGTQTGETLAPELDSIDLDIAAENGGLSAIAESITEFFAGEDDEAGTTQDQESGTPSIAVIVVLVLVGLVGVGALGIWLGRRSVRRN